MSGNATKVGFNGANSTFASFKLGSKPDMYQGFGEIKLTGSVKVGRERCFNQTSAKHQHH